MNEYEKNKKSVQALLINVFIVFAVITGVYVVSLHRADLSKYPGARGAGCLIRPCLP